MAERDDVLALCERIGYGRVLQLASALWIEKAEHDGPPSMGMVVGPHRGGVVPCEHPGADPHCDWCCGCDWVTERVRNAQEVERLEALSNGGPDLLGDSPQLIIAESLDALPPCPLPCSECQNGPGHHIGESYVEYFVRCKHCRAALTYDAFEELVEPKRSDERCPIVIEGKQCIYFDGHGDIHCLTYSGDPQEWKEPPRG